MNHRQYVIAFITLILCSMAAAHDWQDQNTAELNQEKLEQMISFVETQQAQLELSNVLTQTNLAKDWLVWLELELGLDSREGQTRLAELLPVFYSDDEFKVLRWRHEMEHITLVYDASFSSVDQAAIIAELESLDANNESLFKQREDLSYALEFPTVSQEDKAILEPFLERLSALVMSAQEGR